MALVRVVPSDSLRVTATSAARDYVRTTREILALELDRRGERARLSPRYQRLEQSLAPEAILRCWPAADLAAVFTDAPAGTLAGVGAQPSDPPPPDGAPLPA
jgi:hypothetical protein